MDSVTATARNGAVRVGRGAPRAIELWSCRKRDGTVVPFNDDKIRSALRRCFTIIGMTDDAISSHMHGLVSGIINVIWGGRDDNDPVPVEEVQRLVIQQLWAQNLFDAAEHYQNYREQRRRAREEAPIDAATVRAFDHGMAYFTGANRHVQEFQAIDKFARYQYDLGRRETWPESVARTMDFFQRHMAAQYPGTVDEVTWHALEQGLLTLQASPSMRCVQMAGPALDRCNVGCYNCSFLDVTGPVAMAEDLYCSMQGTGVGFSVEYKYAIDKWPRVRKNRGKMAPPIVVPDDTEGWCDTLKDSVEIWLDGGDVTHDFSGVRKKGTPLRTKGGRASGAGPLIDALSFARTTILSRQNDRLTSLDVHDMTCMVHRVGQMGGVRRASGLSCSDQDDMLMRHAKDGQFWATAPQRNQANNAAVYEERPTAVEFMEEWLTLAKSGNGERGILNAGSIARQIPKRRKRARMRTNPCGEIHLRDRQFCNLSIAVLNPATSWDEVRRRVKLATLWGTFQSTMTRFNYLSPEWKRNCEEERLLGVDLLGHLDHGLLRPGGPDRARLLDQLLADCSSTNVEWAQRLGINPSAALTCGKPSGDSSCFFDVAAGFKPHHGPYYIRRFRIEGSSPVARLLKDAGVPWFDDYDKSGLLVFEFPCQAPANAVLLGDQSAIEQLENWLVYKEHWTEHNPSITVYVKEDEWLDVGYWVWSHWDQVGGLSFLPYDGGSYPLAPYQAIDETEYQQRAAAFPEIDWSKIVRYETSDMTTLSKQFACTGGACEI